MQDENTCPSNLHSNLSILIIPVVSNVMLGVLDLVVLAITYFTILPFMSTLLFVISTSGGVSILHCFTICRYGITLCGIIIFYFVTRTR